MPTKIMLIKMKNTRRKFKAFLLLICAVVLSGIVIHNLKPVVSQPPKVDVPVADSEALPIPIEPILDVQATEVAVPPALVKKNTEDKMCWPLTGEVTREFGWQLHPILQEWRYHAGIDIAAGQGTSIKAMFSGVVEKVYQDEKTGLTVSIRSGSKTVDYGSLSEVTVNPEEKVEAGGKIGKVGVCPGEPSPHLHLAVKIADQFVDVQKLAK